MAASPPLPSLWCNLLKLPLHIVHCKRPFLVRKPFLLVLQYCWLQAPCVFHHVVLHVKQNIFNTMCSVWYVKLCNQFKCGHTHQLHGSKVLISWGEKKPWVPCWRLVVSYVVPWSFTSVCTLSHTSICTGFMVLKILREEQPVCRSVSDGGCRNCSPRGCSPHGGMGVTGEL